MFEVWGFEGNGGSGLVGEGYLGFVYLDLNLFNEC